MERPLVNEYVELFKKAHDISDQEWNCDGFYKPLKEVIESSADESLVQRISKLREWAIQKGKI